MNRSSPYWMPRADALQRFRDELTPEYWADRFCRERGDTSRLRSKKEFHEYYVSTAFSWWIQVRNGMASSFRLLDVGGVGEPDVEFKFADRTIWVEVFRLHFPDQKHEQVGGVHRFDKLVRERLADVPFEVTTNYASHRDLPLDGRLRKLARAVDDDLASQLSASDEASVTSPVRVSAKRSRMATVIVGTSDSADPERARASYAGQLNKHLPEALRKLTRYDIDRGCVLIVTDETHAPKAAATAFSDIAPDLYSDCGGVFWFNCSRRPYSLRSLYEKESLFGVR